MRNTTTLAASLLLAASAVAQAPAENLIPVPVTPNTKPFLPALVSAPIPGTGPVIGSMPPGPLPVAAPTVVTTPPPIAQGTPDAHLNMFPEPAMVPGKKPLLGALRGPNFGPVDGGEFGLEDSAPGFGDGWVSAELLRWKLSRQELPPLVAAAPRGQRPLPGSPGTVVLLDDDDLDGHRNGLRLSAGLWLNGDHSSAIEVNAFFLDPEWSRRGFASTGIPSLGRPFFNVDTGRLDVSPVGFQEAGPGGFTPIVAGQVDVRADSELWGFEASYRRPLDAGTGICFDALLGYRFLRLTDGLSITERKTVIGPGGLDGNPPGTRLVIADRFRSENTFNGLQGGIIAQTASDCFTLTGTAKLALGHLYELTEAEGLTTTTTPGGGVSVTPGGLLAGPNATDRRTRNRFAVIPEVGILAGYQVTPRVKVMAGYSVMYLCNFARTADLIDAYVGDGQPDATRTRYDICVRGGSIGLELSW